MKILPARPMSDQDRSRVDQCFLAKEVGFDAAAREMGFVMTPDGYQKPESVQVEVRQYAFGEGEIRLVDVPKARWDEAKGLTERLGLVFHYGQNDFQPRNDRYSVSVADVIDLGNDELYVVKGMGFKAITAQDLEELKKTPQRQRSFCHTVEG